MEKTLEEMNWERASGLVNGTGFARDVGITLTKLGPGCAEGTLMLTEKHKNPLNNAHGGVLYTLCDTISGVAGASYGGGGATVQSSVSFLRPAVSGLLTCRASVRKDGKKLIWVDCAVTSEEGKELCTGQFLYMQMPGIAHFGIQKEGQIYE
ncbi:MAG: PaaI family thioesterase [Lachnospiraceae bacterium]|nr:PaaI family thioesterase [Lachnospiraceae bacterium]MBQ4302884.1 PaaI family thioesterase [Lachnospiraceae bacterium]